MKTLKNCEEVYFKTSSALEVGQTYSKKDLATLINEPRLSDVRAQRVVRVLVLRRHRQHIVEAGNPLEVGDAQVNRRGLLALEHLHPVGHGWLNGW